MVEAAVAAGQTFSGLKSYYRRRRRFSRYDRAIGHELFCFFSSYRSAHPKAGVIRRKNLREFAGKVENAQPDRLRDPETRFATQCFNFGSNGHQEASLFGTN